MSRCSAFMAVIMASSLVAACGGDNCEKSGEKMAASCKSSQSDAKEEAEAKSFIMRGSIITAFPVEIDGTEFEDMERYWSAENARLPDRVAATGYAGYDVKFEADIGFEDLTRNMVVYVAPKDGQGLAAKTRIGSNDSFAVTLEPEAASQTLMLRGNKRIDVVITNGTETIRWCYNFGPMNLEIAPGEAANGITLRSFRSSLVTYKCDQDADAGSLEIPTNTAVAAASKPAPEIKSAYAAKIAPGADSKAVYDIAGTNELAQPVKSAMRPEDTIAEYRFYRFDQGVCEADVDLNGVCDCWILVRSDDNTIVTQEGLRAEYLAPNVSWPTASEAVKNLEP